MKNRLILGLIMLTLTSYTAFAHMYQNLSKCGSDCSGTCVYSDSAGDSDHTANCIQKSGGGCDC